MLLSRSLRRKFLATAIGACAFLLLYQATVIDSRKRRWLQFSLRGMLVATLARP